MSEAVSHQQRAKFLDGLADMRREARHSTRRYTHVHGDHRIYHSFGARNDTCYGTPFDPRVVDALASDGLIKLTDRGYGDKACEITDEGMAVLNVARKE